MRYLTAGESHGPSLTAIIEGLPSNLQLDTEAVNSQLSRRRQGYGRGGRMKIEADSVEITAGLRFGRTLGSPLAIHIKNRDFANWEHIMSPDGVEPLEAGRVTRPRPGHADLAGALKYDLRDIRDVLERASARETAARTAVGAVARQLLQVFGIRVFSHVLAIGAVVASSQLQQDWQQIRQAAADSPVSCADTAAAAEMINAIDRAREEGDSLGGVFEIIVTGVPAGLGSHVQWDRKLDGRLAGALMSIQAVKGVEIGAGFAAASLPGSLVHDEISYAEGRGYYRFSNRAGGIEGGITNGEALVLRAAMKPIPTLYKPLQSVDMDGHKPFAATVERSDTCAVPAASVVAEAVVAWEVASAFREKFGGDSMAEIKSNYESYLRMLAGR
jgi:chorismate synthase